VAANGARNYTQLPNRFSTSARCPAFVSFDEFKNAAAPVNVIYSQSLGYLNGNQADYFGSDRISACRSDPAVNFVYAHTSGHAPVEELKKLATALKPRMLVSIHTEHGEDV
jgi:ribonuclease J